MPRAPKPLRIIETFAPDPARCADALLRLLAWEPLARDQALHARHAAESRRRRKAAAGPTSLLEDTP
jgi:hypothetical protein